MLDTIRLQQQQCLYYAASPAGIAFCMGLRRVVFRLQDAKELESIITGQLPAGWEDSLPTYTPEDKGLATRLHSQTMLNSLATAIPGACTVTLCMLSW